MQAITAKRLFVVVIAVFAISFLVGCAGMEKRPKDRTGWFFYYPAPLVNADRALDDARLAGKDKECPQEFNALKDRVDEVWKVYRACDTQGAINMANDATAKIKALCPPPPTCELTVASKDIEKGKCTTLILKTSDNSKSAVLDKTWVEATGGTKAVCPTSTTTYSAEVTGDHGSSTCSVTVTVTMPPPPPPAAKVIDRLTIHVNFDFDKSDIRKADEAELKKAVDFVRKYPDAKVDVEGHTDSRGTEEYNHKLSHERAEAVRQYLIKEGAVDEARISARGYGESRPIAPNTTKDGKDNPEGRAENRRAEILIISE